MQKPSHAAICLEKALAYVNAANAQIDLVIIEKKATHGEKAFWNVQKNRLGAVMKDVFARIPKPEARDIIRNEMADEFRLDALLSLYAQMNEQGRDNMEAYANDLLNGIDKRQAA